MKRLRKWPLLYRDSTPIGGRPYRGRVKAAGVSSRAIWASSAGIESSEHVKECQRLWPWLTEKEIRQAIRFESSRGRCAGKERYD